MQESLLIESIFAVSWALILCIFAIPPIIFLSHSKKILDEPSDRRIHLDSTPRLGGLAIFAAFMSAATIFGDFSQEEYAVQQLMAGTLLLFFAGVKDDIVPITPFKKFFVQLMATGIVVFVGGIRVTCLHGFLGVIGLENIGMSYAFTFVTIIAITNAINLIDGLNGLAGSLVMLVSIVFGCFFYQMNSPLAVIAFALTGSLAGFLRYNFSSGRIFMGDSGSLVIGFLVAVFAVQFLESDLSEISKTPHLTIAILIIPLFDTLRVFITRLLNGRSPFSPDQNHIHHKLMQNGFSQIGTVLTLLGFNVMMIIGVYFLPKVRLDFFVLGLIVFAVIVSAVFHFSDKRSENG